MTDNFGLDLAIIFNTLLPLSVASYGAAWAFSIRRVLVGSVYRNHALWLGVICIGLPSGLFIANLSSSNTMIFLALSLCTAAFLAFFFAFVDSTVKVARLSDPLKRWILHWRKVRFVLWGDLVLATVYLVYGAINPAWTNSGFWGAVGFPLFLLPFILGAPAVIIGARRSRDRVLRGSLKWFGAVLALFLANASISFVELVVLGISSYDSSFSYPALAFAPMTIIASYCLYRSARSLAPINPLPAVESEKAI